MFTQMLRRMLLCRGMYLAKSKEYKRMKKGNEKFEKIVKETKCEPVCFKERVI